MSDDEKRIVLTVDEAIAMLPDGDNVHTFSQPSGMFLVGADWRREEVIELFRKSLSIELSGEQATNMGHGICFWDGPADKGRWYFVETKPMIKHEAVK